MRNLKITALAILFCFLHFFAVAQDKFADIGTRKYETREHLLVVPQAPVLTPIDLPLSYDKNAAFKPVVPISTKEELYEELGKIREKYKPFLQNVAPKPKNLRERIALTNFKWRVETPEDLSDFSSTLAGKGQWEEVEIPHFAPPLGRAVTYYRKEIELDQKSLAKGSLFICFKGIDYKCSVFINGSYVGSHEGFFAPFEFDISKIAHEGKNTILVKVENDYSTTGARDKKGNKIIGDKIYAATGPGYDEPKVGWHHGSPGMGIYQDCYLEARSSIHINDIFVRPVLKDSLADIENYKYEPSTTHVPGVGDLAKPTDWEEKRLKMGYGVNFLRVPLKLKRFRLWNNETPWLYQIQVKIFDETGKHIDTQVKQFGMREFRMDTVSVPKGKMYLNGEMIRLRGANTMGHLQQCVIRKDWDQLVDDILLAKLCNMNFIRLTQRVVQPEIYEYFDKLGLMNQSDLPLFGAIRRNKFVEAVKQAEEMEKIIRSHPSAVMVSYINERFPNAEGHPQRSLNTLEEYNSLFTAMDQAVLLNNPDRVIKPGDGDYDPPSPGLPDSHCYNTWYNGHGLGLGEMYRGQWQPIKPDWLYACGEFGAEGLDPLNTIQKYYPKEWLPKDKEDEKIWNANRISMSQTHRFHYMWYNTQHSLQDWINASQDYQAWAIKFVTETFRRDPRMVSFAVHLFIDAWPAGWMKTIMDVDRQPKKAYFAYRNALKPVIVSLRSDRRQFYEGEETAIEAWVCNDYNEIPKGYQFHYQLEKAGKVIFSSQIKANIPPNASEFQGYFRYKLPTVSKRTPFTIRAGLFDEKGNSVYQNTFELEVFPNLKPSSLNVYLLGKEKGLNLMKEGEFQLVDKAPKADVILIEDYDSYCTNEEKINALVEQGKKAVFLDLPAQNYRIAGTEVKVSKTAMGNYYFVSPNTGHPLVKAFQSSDFWLWYNRNINIISPILAHTIIAPKWQPILASGASNWVEDKGSVMAVAELSHGKGVFRICEVQLAGRLKDNPIAALFLHQILN